MIRQPVRTETYYREDVRTMLQAIDDVNRSLLELEPLHGQQQMAAYRAGFAAAVQAIATAFDVSLEPSAPMVIQVERQLLDGYRSR